MTPRTPSFDRLVRPSLLCCVALLLVQPPAARSATPADEPGEPARELEGTWEATRRFGPEVSGTLLVRRQGGEWRVEIAGWSAPAVAADGALHFELPGDRGAFRGRLEDDDERILGHWTQPRTVVQGVRYASPVELRRSGPDLWRGEVVPLEDEMTLFLAIEPRDHGTVGAFLRNPERNVGISLGIEEVLRDGEAVRFVGRFRGSDERQVLLEGTLRAEPEALSIRIPSLGGTYDFRRLAEGAPSAFRPRPGGMSPGAILQPPELGDGWATGTLEEVGMAPGPIHALLRKIVETPIDSVRIPSVHALLVARHGKLVVEEYFHGFHRNRPHDTRSASKSLTSTLVGVARHEGVGPDLQAPVYPLLRGGGPPPDLDPRKLRLTVEHLLTMTSGLECDDNDPATPGNEDVMQSQEDGPDWLRYALDLPMAREPGAQAVYCSAGVHLLGGVLARATGARLPDYFLRHLARPLGIERYHWNLTPTGDAYGGGGVHWLPRDFLKLGQLHLDGGVWNGLRLLDEDWVRRATSPVETLNDQGYGYAWWVLSYPYRDRTVQAFYAGGNGGQMVIAVPELDLAMLVLAGNYGDFPALLALRDEYLGRHVLQAVAEGEGRRRLRGHRLGPRVPELLARRGMPSGGLLLNTPSAARTHRNRPSRPVEPP